MKTLPKYFRKDVSMKSLEITALEWFDRVNGNSHHSVCVIVNKGLKNEFYFSIPFQYGYGDYYKQSAFEHLIKVGAISRILRKSEYSFPVFSHITKGCKKVEVISFGEMYNEIKV